MLSVETIFEEINKYCDFGGLEYGLGSDDDFYEVVVSPLRSSTKLGNWTYDTGATKGVLIFRDCAFVIKIPFYGKDGYGSKRSRCGSTYVVKTSWYHNHSHLDYPLPHEAYRKTYHYSYGVMEFSGPGCSSKRGLKNDWDYCELEAERYIIAKENGYEAMFAETKLIGYIDDYPIYSQPKCITFCDSESSSSSKKERSASTKAKAQEIIKEIDNYCFNEFWFTDLIEMFGEDYAKKFLTFLRDNDYTEDLHNANIGYIDEVPVLLDYSGYND